MSRRTRLALALPFVLGCATQDIPQAHRGWLFDRTGALAFYAGGKGFAGPVLDPGTYYTGLYDELRIVDCSMMTVREPLNALTKDGVQFGLDIYVRFSADCSDESVKHLLRTLSPDAHGVIPAQKVYETFVRPAIGEAVRETVSPYRANDINDKREEILDSIRKSFMEIMHDREKEVVLVFEVNLSNLDFPDAMDAANVDRAVQAVLKDKAIAERERVSAEIETQGMRKELEAKAGEAEAARIDAIGAALKRNPEYLQFDLQQKMPEIYERAGANGNLVITAPEPGVVVAAKPVKPASVAPNLSTTHGASLNRPQPLENHQPSANVDEP